MEPQSPTPQRPDDVKPADAPPVPPADAVTNGPADAPAADAAAPPAPPLTPMGWLQQNSPFLLLAAAVIGAIYYYQGFDGLLRWTEVGVGLCLLIFIHELGHFLAAKWCNVRVQTFSLGFGPALPGCSVKYGETTYKIGVIPLGGFVQMTGEGTDSDEDDNDPRSYKNKTVLQRMLIISAGVVMNVLLGCVCFVIVYQFHGVPMPPAVVWRVDAGSPAWKAGIPSGAVFTEIGSTKKPTFENLKESVALDSWWTGSVHLVYRTLDGQSRTVDLRPRLDANDSQPVIGVLPPPRLLLWPKKNPDNYDRPAFDNSAAAAARAVDLRPGDVVVRASDPDKGDEATDIPHDVAKGTFDAALLCERMAGLKGRDLVLTVVRADTRKMIGPPEEKVVVPAAGFDPEDRVTATTNPDRADDVLAVKELREKAGGEAGKDYVYFDYQERMKRLAGRPAVVQVLRVTKGPNDAITSTRVNVLVPPAYHQTLGMRMKMGEVAAIRDGSPASDKVREGDKIVAARVSAASGTLLLDLPEDKLDPVRLPFQLEQAAARAPEKEVPQVVLTVKRWDEQAHVQKDVELTLAWDDSWRFDEERPMSETSAMAIPELGIAYRVESTVVHVEPGSAADKAGVKENDRVEEICFKKRQKNGTGDWDAWNEMKSDRTKPGGAADSSYDQWAFYFAAMQTAEFPEVKVRVARGNARQPDMELALAPDRTWPQEQRGILFQSDLTMDKADNFLEAVGKGVGRTTSFMRQLYMGFANILTGRISFTKHAEGPIRLAQDTFEAAQDPYMLTLWLGLISVNLAVVNFLPIPVLDGGHMVFLIYELIRRRPPSDAVRAAASYVGLAALGLLMLFVICLDVMHLWTHK